MSRDEFSIIIPPAQNPSAEIIHRRADRKGVEFFQRAVVAKLMAQLNNTLQDAAMRVGEAPGLYEARERYGSFGYGVVYGRGQGDQTEEQLRRLVDKIKLYENWRARMYKASHMSMCICERVCQREDSLEQIRKDERISWNTAKFGLQFGLNEYCILAGWGDQIG